MNRSDTPHVRRAITMTRNDEIRRRVEEADIARSATRSAAAQHIGELARRHATIADQLADIERQLGDALAEAQAVIDIPELARFTEVSPADLTRWLTNRKPTRAKRKKPAQQSKARESTSTPTRASAGTPASARSDGLPASAP
jgi:hypothetical protein